MHPATSTDMSLRLSYSLIAPVYDLVADRTFRSARQPNLDWLSGKSPGDVLLLGVGTGLDLPQLPRQHRYYGLDLTPGMLDRSVARARVCQDLRYQAIEGNAQRLPLADHSMDYAILHLILAVVPEPRLCLQEAARILRPDGHLLILDKFLRPDDHSLSSRARRWASCLSRHVATRLDVVFEDTLAACPALMVEADESAMASGWFRRIRLRKGDAVTSYGNRR